jgi:hypothetical protein
MVKPARSSAMAYKSGVDTIYIYIAVSENLTLYQPWGLPAYIAFKIDFIYGIGNSKLGS